MTEQQTAFGDTMKQQIFDNMSPKAQKKVLETKEKHFLDF